MAWLELDGEYFHVAFRFGNQRFKRSLRTKERKDAETHLARLEENIRLVERGRLVIPEGANAATFLLSDGKLNQKPRVSKAVTLTDVCDKFFQAVPSGAIEENSLYTMKIHVEHFMRFFGQRLPFDQLSVYDLQRYIEHRSRKTGRPGETNNRNNDQKGDRNPPKYLEMGEQFEDRTQSVSGRGSQVS